ncbi:DUF6790 family protein [Coxiella burnetii]|uniref:DUF6790 family protein n=1 Tax=Coxiella burnetii TaxID=777 RepID=UPI00051F1A61|nr:DUF6790 family protein [Coxiella burnetii]AIT64280.1 putative membrane spanning protein [Coxiella burnetii str. Namibia]
MVNNFLILLCILLAVIHHWIKRNQYSKKQIVDLYLSYFLFFTVGLVGLIGFISHVFYADQTARMIGWAPGSPFQFEVGFHDGAWGLLGILSLWIRDKFWLATGLGWSFFMLGATYGHIHQMAVHGNFAPYNAGIILSDLLIPVILLVLLYLKFVKFSSSR